MQVFKFGGSVIKHFSAYSKILEIIKSTNEDSLVIVVSAIDKTTSKLIDLCNKINLGDEDYINVLNTLYEDHVKFLEGLSGKFLKNATNFLNNWKISLFNEIKSFNSNKIFEFYDKIVSHGELISGYLLTTYLSFFNHDCKFLDSRYLIETDSCFTSANIIYSSTKDNVKNILVPQLKKSKIVVTQGYIGKDKFGRTTTLGKEGSDYTASILASVLEVAKLILWKDVPGIMSSDPKIFKNSHLINEISYKEMYEISTYGCNVLHYKTIEPIINSDIKLQIKFFSDSNLPGTVVHRNAPKTFLPIYIFQKNQIIIKIFLKENNVNIIQKVIKAFSEINLNKIKIIDINLFSILICLENDLLLINSLKDAIYDFCTFEVHENINLLIVKNIKNIKNIQNDIILKDAVINKDILLEKKYNDVLTILYN